MSDPSQDQMSDSAVDSPSGALHLHYAGVSSVERSGGQQRVSLFTNHGAPHSEGSSEALSAQVTIEEPLAFREAMRVLLTLHQPKGSYLPEDPETYSAYADWRRGLDPKISPLEMTRSFYQFLSLSLIHI